MEFKRSKNGENVISKIYEGSIGNELGIVEGDVLLSINGQKIEDIIEYKYHLADEYLELEIRKCSGEVYIYEIEKEYDEDIGLEFYNPIIDEAKSCRNKCVFCFIDQLPMGMRETLYFKDDDSRLSFLQGNFITLTNMSSDDIDKIVKYRISPINISVHTTDPSLRIKMLNNKNAGNIYEIMKRLADNGIQMNCQIVLCPGYNDGHNLEKTVNDLSKLYPNINSVAVVPIGLTKFRENLKVMKGFDENSSRVLIDEINNIQQILNKKINTKFVFLSDEFFILAKENIPKADYYEGFIQLENGVGLISKLHYEIEDILKRMPIRLKKHKVVSIATGESAFEFMVSISKKITNSIFGLTINVYKIRNDFFGESITVAGLITAKDIINQLKDKNLGDALVITKSMLKADEDIFLDDITLEELKTILNINIIPSENEGRDLINKLMKQDGRY